MLENTGSIAASTYSQPIILSFSSEVWVFSGLLSVCFVSKSWIRAWMEHMKP